MDMNKNSNYDISMDDTTRYDSAYNNYSKLSADEKRKFEQSIGLKENREEEVNSSHGGSTGNWFMDTLTKFYPNSFVKAMNDVEITDDWFNNELEVETVGDRSRTKDSRCQLHHGDNWCYSLSGKAIKKEISADLLESSNYFGMWMNSLRMYMNNIDLDAHFKQAFALSSGKIAKHNVVICRHLEPSLMATIRKTVSKDLWSYIVENNPNSMDRNSVVLIHLIIERLDIKTQAYELVVKYNQLLIADLGTKDFLKEITSIVSNFQLIKSTTFENQMGECVFALNKHHFPDYFSSHFQDLDYEDKSIFLIISQLEKMISKEKALLPKSINFNHSIDDKKCHWCGSKSHLMANCDKDVERTMNFLKSKGFDISTDPKKVQKHVDRKHKYQFMLDSGAQVSVVYNKKLLES